MEQPNSRNLPKFVDALKVYRQTNDCGPLFSAFGQEVPPPGESRNIIRDEMIAQIIAAASDAAEQAEKAAAQAEKAAAQSEFQLRQTQANLQAVLAQLEPLLIHEIFEGGADPMFDISAEKKDTSTRNRGWPNVPGYLVEEMDEYMFEAIQEELGPLLHSQTSLCRWDIESKLKATAAYLKPQYEIEVQDTVQSYIMPILQKCVQAGLDALPELLGVSKEDANLRLISIGGWIMTEPIPEVANRRYLRLKKRKGVPDWSIYLHSKNGVGKYVTVGETQMNPRWNSSWLPKCLGGNYANGEAQWQMRKQAKYCLEANTSWSFLYSPKEVVLFRFYLADKTLDSPMGVQWKSIPMSPDRHIGGWGPMMAIWSWIMFSYLDRNRELQPLNGLCALSQILPSFLSANNAEPGQASI